MSRGANPEPSLIDPVRDSAPLPAFVSVPHPDRTRRRWFGSQLTCIRLAGLFGVGPTGFLEGTKHV